MQYRKNELKQGYTRRELAADFIIHVKGIVLSVVGVTLLLARVAANPSSGSAVAWSLGVYGVSLILMFVCSAAFNGEEADGAPRWRTASRRPLIHARPCASAI